MLELRPICENCAKPLPPSSPEARICSFECTFCADCVAGNVTRKGEEESSGIPRVPDALPGTFVHLSPL